MTSKRPALADDRAKILGGLGALFGVNSSAIGALPPASRNEKREPSMLADGASRLIVRLSRFHSWRARHGLSSKMLALYPIRFSPIL
ncbi:MAG: hypothetical protein WDO70_08485 [Alphaproteobacteria bacterium]